PLAGKKGLELVSVISENVTEIKSDKLRFEQIFINLLTNAIKFTEVGSVCIACELVDDTLVTKVTDTGIGIEEKDLEKLFIPFSQIETGITRNHEGTGLGLSISKKLSEKLGGAITVESEPGVGSTFTVTLPLS
ncbi:MAG: ATP-binding protein, partial [Bacteroidales bacterium]|nr:ATP-binding protein [Bacteroidales bacterium]